LDAQLVILEKSGRLTPQTKIKTKSFGEQEDQMETIWFRLLALKDFIILVPDLMNSSVPDEGYFRHASYTLN
jgi:hypothetical protein